MMVADRELMTVLEAAKALGIPKANIRDWLRRGKLTTYKPEIGRILVDVNEIREKTKPRPRD